MVSGLQINLGKSKLFPVGDIPNMAELASSMGCEVDSFPATYLGLPQNVKYSSKAI